MVSETFRRAESGQIRLASNRSDLARDLALLLFCLDEGRSILASPDGFSDASHLTPKGEQRLFCQSSGSTGSAKTIRRSAASWTRSFAQTAALFSLGRDDLYAVLGALSHSLTLYAIFEGILNGTKVDVLTGLSPRKQALALQEKESRVLYATPAQLRLLLAGAKMADVALPAIKLIFSGGGKLDEECRADLESLCPNGQILEFFGASETSLITLSNRDCPLRSVGRTYPLVDLQIRDERENVIDKPGQIGEIWVRSPYLFDGYATGSSKDTRWLDNYLTIGEMGYLDADGFLFLKGRKSRMVTVADQNVFLEEVEAILQKDPNVLQCAALKKPDPKRGHVIVAVVSLVFSNDPSMGFITAYLEHLSASCRAQIGALAAPKAIYRIDSMPLLPAGKPDLIRLQAWLSEQGEALS